MESQKYMAIMQYEEVANQGVLGSTLIIACSFEIMYANSYPLIVYGSVIVSIIILNKFVFNATGAPL